MRLGRVPRSRRAGAVAALFAMLLQLAIAAAHHHAGLPLGTVGVATEKALAAASRDTPSPASDEAACEICLGLALGSTFVQPDAVALDVVEAPLPAPRIAPQHRERPALLAFHSRAPPLSL